MSDAPSPSRAARSSQATRRQKRRQKWRSGDLGPAVAWTCPCCGGAAEARFGADGRTVAVCHDDRCRFVGVTDHVVRAA